MLQAILKHPYDFYKAQKYVLLMFKNDSYFLSFISEIKINIFF